MSTFLSGIYNWWHFLSWKLSYSRVKRWREFEKLEQDDGSQEKAFSLVDVCLGANVFVSSDALFYKGSGFFLDASFEAVAHRTRKRDLGLVRDQEGFLVTSHSEDLLYIRTVSDQNMPKQYFRVTNPG